MLKPLLRVMPNLSGNVKLACDLTDISKINDNTFEATVRSAHLYPLSSSAFQQKIDVGLLFGAWEFDLVKFYKMYSDIFYKDLFSYDKSNLLLFNDISKVINDRNTDFEYGCKRVSYSKSGYQLAFFAPIYCESINDIPDYFEITVDLINHNMYSITKKIQVKLNDGIHSSNHLSVYLRRYLEKINDNVIFMLPATSQAVYDGIDVMYGGFNKYTDNQISQNFLTQTTINGYDAKISNGFKRNHLILKQVLPLSFYFNINDFLTYTEKLQYVNAELKIKGRYYKDGKEVDFYNFSDDYDFFSLDYKKFNMNTGELETIPSNKNILGFVNDISLGEANYTKYKFSNKLNKFYNHWKLKYSSDEYPYITNTNYSFSINQSLYNMYGEFPQNYYYSSLLYNVVDNNINVLIPVGSNIAKYYKDYTQITDKYELSMNNFISNWFDITDERTLDFILDNSNWQDVHPEDNKVLFNGILYDFSKIYNKEKNISKIDKFAVLFYIDTTNFISNNTVDNFVKSNYSLTYNTQSNNIFSNIVKQVSLKDEHTTLGSLYYPTNKDNNYEFSDLDYFAYNESGTGKFVDIRDLGIDYYVANRYYEVSDLPKNIQNEISKNNLDIVESKEIVNIHYVSNISNIITEPEIIMMDLQCASVNNINTQFSLHKNIDSLLLTNENKNTYILLKKHNLIAYTDLLKISNIQLSDDLPKYEFIPKYVTQTGAQLFNVCSYIYDNKKFYGDTLKEKDIETTKDILYIDEYNTKEFISSIYEITGVLYIKDIIPGDNVLSYNFVLSDINNESTISLYAKFNNLEEYIYFCENELDIKETFVNNYDSEFELPKYITKISNVKRQEVDNSNNKLYDYCQVTYAVSRQNYNSENIHVGHEQHKYQISYQYYLYPNISSDKTISLTYNTYINSTKLTGYSYVSSIDNTSYTITLSTLTGMPYQSSYNDTMIIYCNSLEELNNIGYTLHCISRNDVNGTISYTNNLNGVGTYLYRKSAFFNHSKELISCIKDINYIDIKSKSNIIHNNITPEFVKCKIENDDYSDYISYFDVVEGVIPIQKTVINSINYDDSIESFYAKLLDLTHLNLYINRNPHNFAKIYCKLTAINNKAIIGNYYLSLRDVFNRLGKNFEDRNYVINNLPKIIEYDYNIRLFKFIGELANNYPGYFELCFYDSFIKISKPIFDNVIALNTNRYNDLYIYKLSDIDNITRYEKLYLIKEDEDLYNLDNYLTPLFNSVYQEKMQNTVIYNSYIMRNITPINFLEDDNVTVKYTLYSLNKPNVNYLIDVSEVYNTYTYSFIYDTAKYNYNTVNAHKDINEYKTSLYNITYISEKNIDEYSYYSYTYYASKIKTYDDVNDFNTEFTYLVGNRQLFDKYNINTYTNENGITYGFFLTTVNLNNMVGILRNISEFEKVNYFTKINGVDIIANHKYLSNMFKQLVPCLNYNVIAELYKIPILQKQFKTSFKRNYYADNNDIIYNKNLVNDNDIILYRYYDSIVPYITKQTNIPTEYCLNTKDRQFVGDVPIFYKLPNCNIYNYPGIRCYSSENEYSIIKQTEYKYFNDNRFINLIESFDIFISNTLKYEEILEYEKEEIVFKYFVEYINKYKSSKYTTEDNLFLFKKYNIEYNTNSTKLDKYSNEKLYTLTYKFTLK